MNAPTVLLLLAGAATVTLIMFLAVGLPTVGVWWLAVRLRGRLHKPRPLPVDSPVQTRWMDAREVRAAQARTLGVPTRRTRDPARTLATRSWLRAGRHPQR